MGVFGALGKGRVATSTDLRLYLPTDRANSPERCRKAGVPAGGRCLRTKAELLKTTLPSRDPGREEVIHQMEKHHIME